MIRTIILAAFAVILPAAAWAGGDLTVCRTIEPFTASAIEHKHQILKLSDPQFSILQAAFEKDGLPIPEENSTAYLTPALDDGTAVILIGVKADGCVWGTISRSADWVFDTFGVGPA